MKGFYILLLFMLFFSPIAFAGPAKSNTGLKSTRPTSDTTHGDVAHELFSPFFYTHGGNEYRSASGIPGPAYWQNAASYQIQCRLDTLNSILTGSELISYTNNSPDSLSFIWLQLDQNAFRIGSRMLATNQTDDFKGGFIISSVQMVNENGETTPLSFMIDETRMKIDLHSILKPRGGALKIRISYSFLVPEDGSNRMGILRIRKGKVFQIAQWYPRIAVYDDLSGWDLLPYLGAGEFYLEYGDFDYEITLPAGMVVAGSGELQNEKQVLTSKQQESLEKARKSDQTVLISRPVIGNESSDSIKGLKTWHFRIANARDVAWAASDLFYWDACRVRLPSGKELLAQSLYPEESSGPYAWSRSTQIIKNSLQFYSAQLSEYPYSTACNIAGKIGGGMEYPGIVFCGYRLTRDELFNVTDHEFGHTWFPMIVGSNERRYAWMDEGFNAFMNMRTYETFHTRDDPEKIDWYEKANYLFSKEAEPIIHRADLFQSVNLSGEAYDKPGLALYLLRKSVLGETCFDDAFRAYVKAWAYKHPEPEDFFRIMENESGEDLGWFWREWFYETATLDQRIDGLSYIDGDPQKGALIVFESRGGMRMPLDLEIHLKKGEKLRIHLPIETWQRGTIFEFHLDSKLPVEEVIIDPDHIYPDIEPANNIWKSGRDRKKGMSLENF